MSTLNDILNAEEIFIVLNAANGNEDAWQVIEQGDIYGKLFDFYFEVIPYGIAKARTGDPYTWIQERIEEDYAGVPFLVDRSGTITDEQMKLFLEEVKSIMEKVKV